MMYKCEPAATGFSWLLYLEKCFIIFGSLVWIVFLRVFQSIFKLLLQETYKLKPAAINLAPDFFSINFHLLQKAAWYELFFYVSFSVHFLIKALHIL